MRSLDGVSFAVPIFVGGAMVKLPDGTYQAVNIVGLDDDSLFGRPELEQGNIQDIYADNAFIVVDDADYFKLGSPALGASFELNNNHVKIVGVARVISNGLNGVPTLYTTYSRAIQYVPQMHFTLSYLLVEPKSAAMVPGIKRDVAGLGYVAFTKDEFNARIANYYIYKTGVGTNILLMTIISFIVGLAISGQTFLHLHSGEPGEIRRAQGYRGQRAQAHLHDPVHGGIDVAHRLRAGILLVTVVISTVRSLSPYYAAMITFWNLALAFGMVLLIGAISGYVGVRRVLKIEPFDIFRG